MPVISAAQRMNIPLVYKNKLKIRKFTSEEGLSQNIVQDILQDSQGFMWFATTGGLNRYDGARFKAYKAVFGDSTGLVNNYINQIVEDKNHRIWIGTSKGLSRLDLKTGRFDNAQHQKGVSNSLSNNWVNALGQDKAGNVWVGTDKGVNKAATNSHFLKFQRYLYAPKGTKKERFFIGAICHDSQGITWVGTSKGLKKIERQAGGKVSFTHYPLAPDSAHHSPESIKSILEDAQGRLWIGTRVGHLYLLDKTRSKVTLFAQDLARVYDLYQDSKQTIWVGTENGLCWVNEKTKKIERFFYPATHLDNITVNCMHEDKSGVLWVGTAGYGLYHIDSKSTKFSTYNISHYTQSPLKENMVWGIFQDKGDRLWLNSAKNGLFHLNRSTGEITNFKHEPANPQSLIHSQTKRIVQAQDGSVWVVTKGGLNKYNEVNQTFERFFIEKKYSRATSVYCLMADKKNALWMTTLGGRIYKLDIRAKKFSQARSKYFGNGWASSIVEDKQGIFWISGRTAIVLYDPKKQQVVEAHRYDSVNTVGLKKNRPLQIFKARSGQLWITTYGDGLAKVVYDKTGQFRLHYYTQKDGLPTNMLYNILEDKQNKLWISTENGIAKFDPVTEKFTNYTPKDGLPNDDFGEGSFFHDPTTDEMFFGGQNGVAAFIPAEVKPNDYIPTVRLTDFQLANESVIPSKDAPLKNTANYTKKIVLTYEQATVFSFEFAALSYASSDRNQYKVKLHGYDKKWRNLGKRNFVTYTGISPGTYHFRVQASNYDGVWNTQGLRVELVILPAWWQTWWFKLGWISFTIFLVVGFYLYRINAIKRQKRVLEETVVLRTKEVVEQKEEIQIQNEELLQQREEITAQHQAIESQNKLLTEKNYHINQSIKAAKTIQEAILPFESKMQDAFQHNYFILYKPKDVVSGDFYWLGNVGNKKILGVIDCTGHGVPGAFMSMIGFTMLNEIVNTQKTDNPADILEQLRIEIRYTLKQDETGRRNGMDAVFIALEALDNQQTKVIFAGAKRPLWYIKPGSATLDTIKGSSVSIGVIYQNKRTIEAHTIICDPNTLFYLSTDGFTDQNNVVRKRFGAANVHNALLKVSHLSLAQQKQDLEETLQIFMEGTEQRDDILLIGVRV
ncbi:ggdef domain protein, putative [Microscilla marina ATCC 23134]|uniref:Ggdef domain protein, putative n=2 Tax=Microscilla marina TaxID=1027 RepID=A1ZX95_MICM2|nr:ggdef domain protein, putative [Microscilla marina ATCC 23134]